MFAVMGGVLGWVALVVWWVFFSRAAWFDRIAAVVLMLGAMAATYPFLDVSLATGAMGFIFPMLAVPGISLAFVIWAVVSRRWTVGMRRVTMAVAIVVACLVWTLVRTGGFNGAFDNDLAWRWTPTAEDRVLALGDDTPKTPPPAAIVPAPAPATTVPSTATPSPAPAAESEGGAPRDAVPAPVGVNASLDWPGFRGRDRDGIVRGVQHRHRLVGVAAEGTVAPADRSWLVVVRGARRRVLYAGTTRPGRDRGRLSRQHRRAGVEAS